MATESVTARSLLITGTVGVGKTSVLLEIGELLTLGDAPFALVDLDWLAWLRPSRASQTTVPDVLSENLGHVARTFRRAGVERLVLARAVRRPHEVESIRAALEPCELAVVRLTAAPSVIARRLGERDSGAPLAEHLAEAGSFAAEAEEAGIGDVVLDTSDRTVSSVARELLVRTGWEASR
jgi:broad-specificity NMP kinase